jgi:hypothetical protein
MVGDRPADDLVHDDAVRNVAVALPAAELAEQPLLDVLRHVLRVASYDAVSRKQLFYESNQRRRRRRT